MSNWMRSFYTRTGAKDAGSRIKSPRIRSRLACISPPDAVDAISDWRQHWYETGTRDLPFAMEDLNSALG